MTFDGHANFAQSLIAVAPSPGISGLSLSVTAGQGAIFPATPFNATVQPIGVILTTVNSEIVRVTNITGDVFTIVRAQEGTTGLNITTGYQIGAAVTAKAFTDIETAVTGVATTSTPLNSFAAPTGNVGMGGHTFTSLNSVSAAPSGTSTIGMIINNPSGTSVDVADFQINGTTAWKVTSTGSLAGTQPLVVAPSSTSAVAATFNNPTSTSVDVADFQVNGVTGFKVNSSGNPALANSSQLDLTSGNTASPFIGNAWQTFTPGWASTGTAPAINTGTLTARYMKIGRVVTFRILLIPNSATTFGTGTYSFNIPVASASAGTQYVYAFARPAGGGYSGTAEILSGASTIDQVILSSGATASAMGATAPATFAANTSNYIIISGTYEAAS